MVSDAHAAGAQIAAARALDGPVPAEPIGAGEIEPAQIGPLQHIRSGLHVVVGHAQRKIIAVVVAHTGQRVAGNVGAIAGRRRGGALRLGAGSGRQSQSGYDGKRGEKILLKYASLSSLQDDTGRGQCEAGENFPVTARIALSSATKSGSAQSSGFRRRPLTHW